MYVCILLLILRAGGRRSLCKAVIHNPITRPTHLPIHPTGYQELVKAIIRPPRAEYRADRDLGPREFDFCGRRFRRRDFEVRVVWVWVWVW